MDAERLYQAFAGTARPAAVIEGERAMPTGLIPAAVLIPIVRRSSGATVLLIRRTAHLRDHAGQISFPGGRCEASDATPEATALREAHEEVGLLPAQCEVLGRLGDYRTSTGFSITPVVALVQPPLDLRLDDFEVAEAFEPPLAFLLDARHRQQQRIEVDGRWREYWAIPWREHFIWGATAGMLVALADFLAGTAIVLPKEEAPAFADEPGSPARLG